MCTEKPSSHEKHVNRSPTVTHGGFVAIIIGGALMGSMPVGADCTLHPQMQSSHGESLTETLVENFDIKYVEFEWSSRCFAVYTDT